MTQPNPPPVVAIFNSMEEILDMVRLAFEAQGFVTATARLADIQSGALDLIAFVKEHKPVALVYDIPRPYEANCNVLRLLRETDSLQRMIWVITTTNKEAVERAVPNTNAIEIVLGKPYTVDEVIDAVRKGLRADGNGPMHSSSFTRYRMPLDGSNGKSA
jgi:DNA-binding NtrC family response regulator